MRILEFIDGFNFENFGGAGRVFIENAKVMSAKGHQINVICRNDLTGNYDNLYGIKFHYYDCKYFWVPQKYYHRRSSIRKIFGEYLQSNAPDIIIIHSATAIFGVTERIRTLNVPKIFLFHSPWCEEHRVNGNEAFPFDKILYELRRRRELKALQLCDGIVTLSRYMQELMVKIHPGIKGKPMAVIPGGADINKFYPSSKEDKTLAREKLGLQESEFVIMTSRRLIPRTGVDILIKAFTAAKAKTGKDMKLLIVGSGILMEELKQLSSSLGMDKDIIFTGFVDEKDLPSYYQTADLFIMPTKELEGFGLSTVEAMACGIPAVGTDVGGTPEILREVSYKCTTGILPVADFNYDDLIIKGCSENAIAEKLIRFSTRESLAGLGEKSLECVRKTFNWKKNVEKLEEFQRHLAGARGEEGR
ncbi:MAG: glycosyltransferase family 4 protein [Victivallales bacterium]